MVRRHIEKINSLLDILLSPLGKLVALTFLVYLLANPFIFASTEKGVLVRPDYFTLLADSFLHRRLDVVGNFFWLDELVRWQGRQYVIYPPFPAVILMPFVAILGTSFFQPFVSILLGTINVLVSYFVFLKFLKQKKLAIWMSALFAFGSMHWFHASWGSAWFFAHIVALFFLWLALLEIATRQRLFLIGLWVGIAYLARLPAILSIIFVLIYLSNRLVTVNKNGIEIHYRQLLVLGAGLFPSVFLNALYNYLRFGTISDFAYNLYFNKVNISDYPWLSNGFFNILYLPVRVWEMFTAMPFFQSKPPFVIPSLFGLAIWIAMPALFLIIFAAFKRKVVLASLFAVIFIALPSLLKGGNGFNQFGFRYILDYMPFLLLMIADGFKQKFTWWAKMLIIISILINLWGVIMILFTGNYTQQNMWGWKLR